MSTCMIIVGALLRKQIVLHGLRHPVGNRFKDTYNFTHNSDKLEPTLNVKQKL